MDESQKLAIIAEVIEMTAPPIARPGDFTLAEYREIYEKERGEQITESSAKRYLKRAVDSGILETEEVLYQGHLAKVFRVIA